jgi:hypothetical protein
LKGVMRDGGLNLIMLLKSFAGEQNAYTILLI